MDKLLNYLSLDFRVQWSLFHPDFSYFSTMSFNDVIDILLVAYIIYHLMKLLKDTSAERLIKGIMILLAVFLVALTFQLVTIMYILRLTFSVAPLLLVIVFQPELRRLLEQLGKGNIGRLLISDSDPDAIEAAIQATVAACADMSHTKTGALIVFERRERLGEIVSTGTLVDAAPSAELLKNIFFKNSPLHDGAMVVREGRVFAAGCVLPLSASQNLSRDLGTRHRAAVGMSETADSVLVVVSEETGGISVAIGGMLKRHLSPEVLQKVLEGELLNTGKIDKGKIAAFREKWKGGRSK